VRQNVDVERTFTGPKHLFNGFAKVFEEKARLANVLPGDTVLQKQQDSKGELG